MNFDETIKVHYFRDGSKELFRLLSEGQVPLKLTRAAPGVVMASGELLEIIKVVGGISIVPSIAAVLIQWLKNKRYRRIIITTKDKKVIHAEGLSKEEFAQLLERAESVAVIQTESDESEN